MPQADGLEYSRRLFLKLAQSTKFKSSVGELMDIARAPRVAINFEYYKGRINPLDFNF